MHVNNYILPRPPQNLLDQCQEVLIGDPAFIMWKMKHWCRDQDLSLVWSELIDVADVSSQFDEVAAFYFVDAKDATMFSLKFK